MKTDKIQPDLTPTGHSLTSVLDGKQLILFDSFKKAMLEIFPLVEVDSEGNPVKPHFDKMSLEFAENFAFQAVQATSDYVKKELKEIEIQIQNLMTPPTPPIP